MQYYATEDKLLYFIYDGISSADFKIVVTKYNNLSSPERNLELVSVPGKNGAHISKKALSNKNIDIEFYIDSEDTEEINILSKQIRKWIQKDLAYKELILSDDLETIYEAVCINKIEIDEIIEALGEGKLTFSCKPYSKNKFNDTIVVTQNNATIYNEYYTSAPKIKIIGNGDITISINNENLILKGIEGSIEVDSETMECYKTVNGIISYHNDKMYSEFPVLEEGVNNISWLGNVTSLEIVPNWLEI